VSVPATAPRRRATAVVCTRNRPEFLPDALASIAAALGANDELIVVESGDSGGVAAVASLPPEAHARLLRSELPGKSHKLNLALRAASGAVIVMTDDDVRVEPGWIDAMVAPFSDAHVGVAFGPVAGLTHHGDRVPVVRPGEAPFVTWRYAHGAAMAVRAAAARAVGGFDERLGPGAPAHGEEHDLLLRLREAGWKAMIAAAPPAGHLEWRESSATERNLLVYERGAGAFVGAALRRHPRQSAKLAWRRLRYQAALLRHSPLGWSTVRAFAGGLVYGLRLRPRRYV